MYKFTVCKQVEATLQVHVVNSRKGLQLQQKLGLQHCHQAKDWINAKIAYCYHNVCAYHTHAKHPRSMFM